jgi:hypothetical protein
VRQRAGTALAAARTSASCSSVKGKALPRIGYYSLELWQRQPVLLARGRSSQKRRRLKLGGMGGIGGMFPILSREN